MGYRERVFLMWANITWDRAVLLGALVALVFSRSIDQAIFYRLSFAYVDYVWYLSTIILAVAFLAISWPVVWYKIYVSKTVTPEMRRIPQYKFAIMGLLDCLFNLFSTFPIAHLGGDLSNVLSQTVLPINMLGSFFFLGIRYKKNHLLGATLILYGVLLNIVFKKDDRFDGAIGWIFLMIASQIPAAASNIYKEIGLKDYDLDVWYANAWIGVWQLLFGVLTFWTVTIKAFVGNYGVPLSRFIDYMHDANSCFFGNSVVDQLSGEVHTYCQDTPLYVFMVFIVFNITYNQLMLFVFKRGSSVLFVLASAVRLPLVDLLVMIPFISGHAHEDFGMNDAFALFILVVALAIYYSEPEEMPDRRELAERREQLLDEPLTHA